VGIQDTLRGFMETFQEVTFGSPNWPPASVKERWEKIEEFKRYQENDRAKLLPYATVFSRSLEGRDLFTPVGLAQEVCRLSADLLFSAQPVITHETETDLLERITDASAPLLSSLVDIAEKVAAEGRGGLRVVRDSDISDEPIITHVCEDQIIWNERHGHYVLGGTVVVEKKPDPKGQEVVRLLEQHSKGKIERALFRGTNQNLGQKIPLASHPDFKDLPDMEITRLDVPTLIRWDNVSGGRSDLQGQIPLLDKINEEYSRGIDKSRKSTPTTFAARELADEGGNIDLWGIILTGVGNMTSSLGEDPAKTVETVQPDFKSAEIIAWLDFLIDSALLFMGYSKASYGRDAGGSADSGKALRLRQSRTLLKKAGKDRNAIEAISEALGVAMAWSAGKSTVEDFGPDIKLGDGLPRDETEEAAEAVQWTNSGAISLEELIRMRRPDWDQEQIDEEIDRIENGPQPQSSLTKRITDRAQLTDQAVPPGTPPDQANVKPPNNNQPPNNQ
jgi:hypothetical protein